VLQLVLLMVAARRANVLAGFARPRWSADLKQFFTAVLPAVIGSAGVQIALFADTIIATLLPTGSVSAIYYADRIYQLPIGVVGIAAGTVLLPEMSRLLAAGEKQAAFHIQNRTMAITLAICAPFATVFVLMPELIMRGVFLRGAFTAEAATAAAEVLMAYGTGLLAMVLIRSAVASFQSQGDTRTPMMISLGSVAINVVLKLFLYEPLGAAGLAYATAIGAWVNFGLLVLIALRRGYMQFDPRLTRVGISVANAAFSLVLLSMQGVEPLRRFSQSLTRFSDELTLALVGLSGSLLYGLILLLCLTSYGVPLWRQNDKDAL
jgi:putative peptidoglycan lipid II flippase